MSAVVASSAGDASIEGNTVGDSVQLPEPPLEALTDEQRAFMAECELDFVGRFSDQDDEYVKSKRQATPPPPIVTPWFPRRPRGGARGSHRGGYNNPYNRDRHRPYQDSRDGRNQDSRDGRNQDSRDGRNQDSRDGRNQDSRDGRNQDRPPHGSSGYNRYDRH